MAYLLSPRYCHRLVGYLEEEAVKTYTELIKLVDGHFIEEWNTERPPPIAIKYAHTLSHTLPYIITHPTPSRSPDDTPSSFPPSLTIAGRVSMRAGIGR